jgi:hypothetical protein
VFGLPSIAGRAPINRTRRGSSGEPYGGSPAGGMSSAGRAPSLGAAGPHVAICTGGLKEHILRNDGVGGSNPSCGTSYKGPKTRHK